jgi:hypothetical protein
MQKLPIAIRALKDMGIGQPNGCSKGTIIDLLDINGREFVYIWPLNRFRVPYSMLETILLLNQDFELVYEYDLFNTK